MSMDVKKLEKICSQIPFVLRNKKPIDSIVLQLKIIKNSLKANKVTLYIIEKELQNKIFNHQSAMRHHYKKIIFGISEIYAVYIQEDDNQIPAFQIDNPTLIFNNKHIVMPISNVTYYPQANNLPEMCLQILYDENNKTKAKKQNKKNLQIKESSVKRSITPYKKSEFNQSHDESLKHRNNSMKSSNAKVSYQQKTGWNQNDLNLIKIFASFLQMSVHCFEMQVIKDIKIQKAKEVIQFSIEIMSAKTYYQIIRLIKNNVKSILGFEKCSIFFEDENTKDLFTVTNSDLKFDDDKKVNDKYFDLSFIKELQFQDNQIIIFPNSLGICGEVHKQKMLFFQNNCGIIQNERNNQKNRDHELSKNQDFDKISVQTNNIQIQKSKGLNICKNQIMLEQIIEDHPQAENEGMQSFSKQVAELNKKKKDGIQNKTGKNTIISKDVDNQDLVQQQINSEQPLDIQVERNFSKSCLQSVKNIIIENNNKQVEEKEYIIQKISEQNYTDGQIIENKSENLCGILKIQSREQKESYEGVQGEKIILDLKKQRDKNQNKSIQSYIQSTNLNQQNLYLNKKYTNLYVPDIDNFQSVKPVFNYCIVSIKDNESYLGEKSVGILQLYNKSNQKNIIKEDLVRIECLSKFVGSLSIKARNIMKSLTMVLGLRFKTKDSVEISKQLDITPGIGNFYLMTGPIDTVIKIYKDKNFTFLDN